MALLIIFSAIAAGAGIWYTNQVAYWQPAPDAPMQLTSLATGAPEPILTEGLTAITADSSPLRYRACFDTPQSLAMLTETYVIIDDAVPTNAPASFDCFDAATIGDGLETGGAIAFLGTPNVLYGIDRIVAITPEGKGYAWHQINECGEVVFDGKAAPEGCPPRPESE